MARQRPTPLNGDRANEPLPTAQCCCVRRIRETGKKSYPFGAADRYDGKYPDLDRFDVERMIGRYLSLGRGTHFVSADHSRVSKHGLPSRKR